MAMADAAEKADDSRWAVHALQQVADSSDGETAERCQIRTIELLISQAEKTADKPNLSYSDAVVRNAYKAAAEACRAYMERFSSGANYLSVEYRGIACGFKAGESERTITDIDNFRRRYPRSNVIPRLLLIEALATHSLGDEKEAIELLLDLMKKHPEGDVAGSAAYAAGRIYLARREVKKAREMFLRIVDFHPNHPMASTAKRSLNSLN
jgi:TolA-binding protein